eukprot:gene12487-13770_t
MVWSSLTTDTEILSTVSGLPLAFESKPDQQLYASKQNFTSEESKFIGTEITNLLQKNVIKESLHEPGEFISPIFLRPKSDGSFRLILNLKKLNKFMPKLHFKMDTINTVTELIHENSYMTKIDLKDAYYSVPINNNDKKYLKFMHKDKLFHFTCLPNGLSCGPRKFTKLLKPALTSLRKLGINIIAYIDDLIIIDDSYQKCVNATQICVSLLDSLGYVIHPEKSNFTPATVIEYLGFSIDATNQTIQLTDSKKNKTKDLCQHVLSAKTLSIRQVAKLLGTLTSAFPGVKFGPLHYRSLESCKIAALKKAKGNFDSNMLLSQLATQDIQWWINNIESSVNVLSLGNASLVLTTDASKTGWGAVTSNSSASGQWTTEESTQHINCLELTAVLFGLKSLLNNVKGVHIKQTPIVSAIQTTGTTSSTQKAGATSTLCQWNTLHTMRLSTTAENIILASWSTGTKKQYGTYARKWLKYCSENHIDYCRASITEIIEFLTDMFKNANFQYSTLNTVRSMLSSMVEPRDGITVGNHPLVKRFMKGIFKLRPSLPKCTVTYDAEIVLQHIARMSPLAQLIIPEVTKKLATLMALLSGQRAQTLVNRKNTPSTSIKVSNRRRTWSETSPDFSHTALLPLSGGRNEIQDPECEICKQLFHDWTQLAKPDSCACFFHNICLGQWKDTVPPEKSINCPMCKKPFTIVVLCDLCDLERSSQPEELLDLLEVVALDEDRDVFGDQETANHVKNQESNESVQKSSSIHDILKQQQKREVNYTESGEELFMIIHVRRGHVLEDDCLIWSPMSGDHLCKVQ